MSKETREENIANATAVNASLDIFFFIEFGEFSVAVSKDIIPNRRVNKIEKIVSNVFDTSEEK